MPELPEVETIKRGLEGVLLNRKIVRARAFSPSLRLPIPKNFSSVFSGRRVTSLGRRAKYILIGLDSGTAALLHLGMSGQVRIFERGKKPEKHDHFQIDVEGGQTILYHDPRRFGLVAFWPAADLENHKLLQNLGAEPLSNAFNGAALKTAVAGKRVSTKAALLDQRVIAGLGNIYASEALFRAGIHPERPAGSLSPTRCERLASEIRNVLREALQSGGSSLRDYVRVDGELGYFQHRFEVYGREAKPCPKPGCPGVIRRLVQNARSTFYCPRCQH